MTNKILLALVLLSHTAYASTYGDWLLLSPRDIHIDTYKNEKVRDAYLAPVDSELSYGAGFNLDLDIAKNNHRGLYWNNLLHFDQSGRTGKVKAGGWQFEFGAVVWADQLDNNQWVDRISVFKQHHSQHIFEEARDANFPLMDRYGVRLQVWP